KKELSTGEPGTQESSSSPRSAVGEERREDVERLCQRLYDRVTANGSKATISDGWRKAARLLLDRDGRELDKALNLIDWAAQDPFWSANVLSMPAFRKQYDQLRLKARAEWQRQHQSQLANDGGGQFDTGSPRVNVALGYLSPNDPLRAQLGMPGVDGPNLYAIEGGKSA